MTPSLPILRAADPTVSAGALRQSLERDGYLFLPGLLPAAAVMPAYLAFVEAVIAAGWARTAGTNDDPPEGRPSAACASPEPAYLRTYHTLYRQEEVHRLAAHPLLEEFATRLFGGPVLRHPRLVGRIQFPGHPEMATPPHQDHLQVQGTAETITFWLPLHDCPLELGSLAISPGSHRLGLLDVEPAAGASGASVIGADAMPWAAAPFARGDAVVFTSHTVHRALPNVTDRFRFSVDCRFQPLDAPVSERSLDFPPTSDQGWDVITAGWEHPEVGLGWRSLDLTVVPYDASVNEERDHAALAQGRSGDRTAISALQRIAAHDTDAEKVAAAVELLRRLDAAVPNRRRL